MPVSSKTKWSQLKVGLLAIGSLTILGFLVFLMSGIKPLFRSHVELYTYLNDSASIANGAPVTINGIQVGKISKVELSGDSRPGRIVKVTLDVEEKYLAQIPADSQATIAAANLLGTKFVNIKKGKSQQIAVAGADLQALESADLDDLFAQGNSTLAAANVILQRLGALVTQVENGEGNLGKIIKDEKLYSNAVEILTEVKKLTADLNNVLDSSDNSIGKLLHDNGAMYDSVQGSLTQVQSIIQGVNDGKGTVGKLLKSDQLADDLHDVATETTKTLTDTRKLLAGIDTKSDDLNKAIQGSLTRIDALLDKINNGQGAISQLLNNPATAEDLDGVMRETQGLLKDFRANPKKFLHIKIGLF
jgi:phospholipid/cholesterol/gamma-HCH transport system substrate-binding protein